jgi:1,4-dihydroxy-2-naphthoate octaprenyltransferase
LIATYGVIIAGVARGVFPYTMLLALLTLPLAYRALRGVVRFHSNTQKLIPSIASTIQLYMATVLFWCLGYAIALVL